MSIRRKSSQRLFIVIAAFAAVLLAGGGVYYKHLLNQQRYYISEREKGLAAFALGQYADASGHLTHFLNSVRNRNDPDVLYKFAVARKLSPEPQDRHLRISEQYFVIYLQKRPDDLAARRQLLEIYAQEIRDGTEIMIHVVHW